MLSFVLFDTTSQCELSSLHADAVVVMFLRYELLSDESHSSFVCCVTGLERSSQKQWKTQPTILMF